MVRGFLVTAMYSTFFLGTLYLEHVLHYSALKTGLSFLPWTLTVAVLSLGLTARLVERFGPRRVMLFGMGAVVVGLLLLSTVGLHTSFFPTIFLAYFAIGLGIGTSFMPLLAIAMADVPTADAGLGSGIVNVSQQVSGALGLAVLGTVAANHSKTLIAQGHGVSASLLGGYHLAFLIGAGSRGGWDSDGAGGAPAPAGEGQGHSARNRAAPAARRNRAGLRASGRMTASGTAADAARRIPSAAVPFYALNLFDLADNEDYLAYSRRSHEAVVAHGGRVVALGKHADHPGEVGPDRSARGDGARGVA